MRSKTVLMMSNNTQSLVTITDNTKLVLDQKLNNAVSERFAGKIEPLRHKKIILMNATVLNLEKHTNALPSSLRKVN
jgi:hypothetical protein